ncbi:MAG: GNAT family N-acetyltransferase [Ilumatobacteraceae bacterium]
MSDHIDVRDVPEHGRFEITVGGEPAGFADYRRDGDVVALPHTVIDPRFRGRGLGAVLATAALDSLKAEGVKVLPQCWFVRDVIAANPDEYLAMVPSGQRGAFGLPVGC